MTDPHGTYDNEPEEAAPTGKKESAHGCGCGGGGCCRSDPERVALRSDPHSPEEARMSGYSAPIPEEAKLPAGVYRCTEGEYAKVSLAVAEVIEAEAAAEPAGALRLTVRLGGRKKTVFAVLGDTYRPVELTGRKIVVADNLEPRRFGDELSYGTVLTATGSDGKPRIVSVDDEGAVESGGQVD